MDISQLEKIFLMAASRVAEEDTERTLQARAVTRRFDFGQPNADWIIGAVENLSDLGFLNRYNQNGGGDDMLVHLTSSGLRKARDLFASGRNAFSREEMSGPQNNNHSDGSGFSDGSGYVTTITDTATAEVAPRDARPDSPGAGGDAIGNRQLEKLTREIAVIEHAIGGLNLANSERQQAMAIVIAIKALAAAPEPPVSVITNLIGLASNIAGIAALFLEIAQIMKSG